MTELNEMNPSDAALNAEPTLETSVENISTENVIETIESPSEIPAVEASTENQAETSNEVVMNEVPPVENIDHVETTNEPNETETKEVVAAEATTNLATDALEIAIDEHEFDADLAAIEHTELHEQNDYASKTKDELLAIALEAASDKPHSEAFQIFKSIKPFFDAALHEEQNIALQKYIEEGGEKDDFEFKSGVAAKDTFNKASKELRDKIANAKAIAEAERAKNLKAKETVLEKIKALNSSEETKDSLAKLKELQTEWKNIKNVPKEHVERLWESYRVLNEIFYDKLSINNEIAQMDRERN
jgi:hypothetical protein